MDLLELRKQIDKIDDELIPLLMKRMDVSEQVAKYKVEHGIPVLNEQRELEILEDVEKSAVTEEKQLRRFLPQLWMLQEQFSIKLWVGEKNFAKI